MPFSIQFTDLYLQRHRGAHIAHSDLENILHIPDWQPASGQHWGLIGGAEHQRSALLASLCEKLQQHAPGVAIAEVSMAAQERLIDAEQKRNQTGIADEIYAGTAVREILEPVAKHPRFNGMLETLAFGDCLDKYFRELSSGQTRKLLLLLALLTRHEALLLHDPLEGLDTATRSRAAQLIAEHCRQSPQAFVLFGASRPEQLPAECTHIAIIEGETLRCTDLNEQQTLQHLIQNWQRAQQKPGFSLPPLPDEHPFHKESLADKSQALVEMRNVRVHYAGEPKPVIDSLNWRVMPSEHWQISGANGSGKTTLLKLVTGDHPQVYNNDITVCGFRRGGGESIWQVKRHIGYMGGEMLWNYRGTAHAGKSIDVVVSGLYDSIGLYTAPNPADRQAAQQWLALFGIDQPRQRFRQLGMAEQRLVLIARAMIKRPALLILDEPLQSLDLPDRQRVLAIIDKLIASDAVTLLYVSHHDDEKISGIANQLTL